ADFWGSIARQLGGNQADVPGLSTNAGTDPHDYAPTPADGRAMASAQLVIVNGIGYDPWTEKVIDANPVSGRVVLNVGETVGLHEGDNPHQWYSPDSVDKVVDAIGDAYDKLDPINAPAFAAQRTRFERDDLAAYKEAISDI